MAYRRNPLSTEELRRQARARVQGLGAAQAAELTQPELQQLLEELEIHQIELELQN